MKNTYAYLKLALVILETLEDDVKPDNKEENKIIQEQLNFEV
jgi:hypothetical protein